MSKTHGNPSDHHANEPPEPKTPMWFTALGAVLFLIAGLLWGLSPSSTSEAETPAGGSESAPATATAAPGAPGQH